MRTGDLRSLHSKAHVPSAIGKAKEWYGERCANCGATEDIEWHQIVPLYVGGTNAPENLVPLCTDCHHSVHYGARIDKHKRQGGGRPPQRITEEQRKAFIDYMFCQIPKKEACKIIGVARIDQWRPPKWMADVMSDLGVEQFKNNLEVNLVINGCVQRGEVTGWVKKVNRKRRRACYAYKDMTAEEFGLRRRSI